MAVNSIIAWSAVFPFCSVLWARDVYSNGEGVLKSIAVVLPLIIYIGTSIYAGFLAHKLKFSDYKLYGSRNTFSTLVGGIFFWGFYFPSFLVNYFLVKSGEASKYCDEYFLPRPQKNGRVIAIVSIWLVVWFIPATQVIPEMTRQKRKVEYIGAIKGLGDYYKAQMVFNTIEFKKNSGITFSIAGYCDNFRNLYYGLNADNAPIDLLSKDICDAFIGPSCGLSTMGENKKYGSEYLGFSFMDDPYMCVNNLWDNQFGLFAIPETISGNDTKMLWIGVDEVLMYTFITMNEFLELSAEDSPANPSCRRQWFPMEIPENYRNYKELQGHHGITGELQGIAGTPYLFREL